MKPFVAILCVTALLPAQERTPPTLENEGRGWHAPITGKYRASEAPPISLGNSGRFDALLRSGRIYLSLADAIALALENNIDIEVQRYGPQLAQADLLRARASGSIRGVSTNVSGGSSGATGGGTGGSGGSGGSNALGGQSFGGGANLDPVLTGTISWGHRTSPQSNTVVTGTTSLVSTNKQYNFGVSQAFLSGTTAQLNFNNFSQFQNAARNDFNPYTSSSLDMTVTQNLLRGFGFAVNNRTIRIAKNNLNVADLTFQQQVISTVANVIALYWDLVSFNEDVKVKKQALALSQKLYDDNRKQVEIGTLAPIEIVRAEAEVAARQQDLLNSETNVLQQETILKNVLSRTGVANPVISEARIVPTDRIQMPDTEPVQPIQDLVTKALDSRPELQQSRIQIENSKINLVGVKNSLLPTVDGFIQLRNNGLAGQINPIDQIDLNGNPIVRNPNNIDPFFLGSYGTVLGQLFRRNFPDYAIGAQLNIPLRNRAAQADHASAQLQLRQNELQVQKQINQIRVDVHNALIAVRQARARYETAQKNRTLQAQTLDAEEKKHALGASTIFLIIQAQRDLANAQFAEVNALSAYARARAQLDVATGMVLENNSIEIEEAKTGRVKRAPVPPPVIDPPQAQPPAQQK